jgi:hypothetical protein
MSAFLARAAPGGEVRGEFVERALLASSRGAQGLLRAPGLERLERLQAA